MSHIIVQNKGELPLWGMRILGYSNKDETQIGRFGTGLKEAIALLSRLDALPIIFSGTCRIDFKVINLGEGEQDEICFKLSESKPRFPKGKWHGLGMHPNLGKHDWTNPWQAFREIFCNALDESGLEYLHHDVVSDEPTGVAGSTRIYVPAKLPLLESYGSIHHKILVLGDPDIAQSVEGVGRIMNKPKDKKSKMMMVYSKGIYVQEAGQVSMYDYDFDDIKLNESRSCDWSNVIWRLSHILAKADSGVVERILEHCFDNDTADFAETRCYESAAFGQMDWRMSMETGDQWRKGFYDLKGSDATICRNEKFVYERAIEHGLNVVVVKNPHLYTILDSAGIKTASRVLSTESLEYQSTSAPNRRMSERFDTVWKWFVDNEMTSAKHQPTLMEFVDREGKTTTTFGSYRDGVCYINCAFPDTDVELEAMIEEIAHYVSGGGDNSKMFENYMIQMLRGLMCKELGRLKSFAEEGDD